MSAMGSLDASCIVKAAAILYRSSWAENCSFLLALAKGRK